MRDMSFNYDELLKKACAQMPEVSAKRERLELPRLYVNTVGMRTIISNFKDVADALDRDPQHILKFLTRRNGYRSNFSRFKSNFPRKISRGQFRTVTTKVFRELCNLPRLQATRYSELLRKNDFLSWYATLAVQNHQLNSCESEKMEVYVNLKQVGRNVLLAVCDCELLGQDTSGRQNCFPY
jgi:hypothetical protein